MAFDDKILFINSNEIVSCTISGNGNQFECKYDTICPIQELEMKSQVEDISTNNFRFVKVENTLDIHQYIVIDPSLTKKQIWLFDSELRITREMIVSPKDIFGHSSYLVIDRTS